MDKQMLIIEMPELDDKAAADLHEFLQYLTNTFELHYLHQIRRYYKNLYREEGDNDLV